MSIIQGTKVIASKATNGFSLFDYKHADHLLNNVSWLRADTFSWQSGNVYKYAYQHLLDEANKIAYYIPSIKEADTGTIYYTWKASNGKYYATLKETPVSGDAIYGYDKVGNVTMSVSETLSSISSEKLTLSNGAVLYRARDALQIDVIDDIEIPCFIAEDKHKICLSDQENNIIKLFNTTGAADYYIVDKTNSQFKLPRKNKRKLIRSIEGSPWYRLYSDGWVEQGGMWSGSLSIAAGAEAGATITFPISMANTSYYAAANTTAIYCLPFRQIRQTSNCGFYFGSYEVARTLTGFCWTVEGYAHDSEYLDVGMDFEYYYVGNFETTSLEQTAGLNKELLNGKLDSDLANLPSGYDFVVDWQAPTEANNYTWYRKYKSGWVEQGGRCTVPATNANTSSSVTVKLPVPISDAAAATLTYNGTASTAYYANCGDQAAITTTSVIIGRWNNGSNTADARYYNWNLSGMAA